MRERIVVTPQGSVCCLGVEASPLRHILSERFAWFLDAGQTTGALLKLELHHI